MNDNYGPNTAQVGAFLALLPTLTDEQWQRAGEVVSASTPVVAARRTAVRTAALIAALSASRAVAWDATWDVIYADWNAADATLALLVRDLISEGHFSTLTAPLRAAGVDFDTLGVKE